MPNSVSEDICYCDKGASRNPMIHGFLVQVNCSSLAVTDALRLMMAWLSIHVYCIVPHRCTCAATPKLCSPIIPHCARRKISWAVGRTIIRHLFYLTDHHTGECQRLLIGFLLASCFHPVTLDFAATKDLTSFTNPASRVNWRRASIR